MAARNPQATLSAASAAPRYPLGRVMMAWLLAFLASSIINLAIFWVATNLLGIQSTFGPFAMWPSLLVVNALALLVAAIVFWFLARRVRDIKRTWDIVALVGLVVSIVPNVLGMFGLLPPQMGEATVSAMLVLIVMHLVSYGVAVGFFPRFGKA